MAGIPPTGVQYTSASTDTVSLSWDSMAGDGYTAVLSTSSDFSVAVSSGFIDTMYSATTYFGLSSNNTYYFRIKYVTALDSDYTSAISTATPPQEPQSAGLFGVTESTAAMSWSQGNNVAGSQYWAELSLDDSFAINTISSGTALSALYTGLNPNATYFMRVRTLGAGGQDSAYVSASTITLAYSPGAEVYTLVSSTTMSVIWGDNGNPSGTRYELLASSDAFSTVQFSSITPGNYYEALSLEPNTTYYYKARAYSWGGVYSEYTLMNSTMTYAAPPAENPPSLGAADSTSVQTQWLANGNPLYTEYYVQASTSADHLGVDYGPNVWFTGPARNVADLESGRTYYFRVRARDTSGRPSGWLDLGSKATLAGADTTPPSVQDLQGGDDTWRGSSSGFYRVHFSDLGSLLDYFQVKVTTGPALTGTLVADWTTAVTGINSDSYTTDWSLPSSVFDAIQENVTSYVSVKVFDNAANYTVYNDAFYVLRDTTPPTITNNAVSPEGWQASDPGAVFDVDAADALSGLGQLLYSASAVPGASDGGVLGWTAVANFSAGPSHTALWGVDFASLRDGATNYISVRAVDSAGNSFTFADAFKILKNTVGPAVSIISPSSAYVSTVSAVSGAASGMTENSPPVAAQVSFQELTGSLYFDGSAFASAAQVWLEADGTTSWSYDASSVPFAAGVQYKLAARARDGDGLYTVLPYPSVTFRLDQEIPSVHLSTPLAGSTVYSLDSVEGTAADTGGSGLDSVKIFVRREADGKWWNFSSGSWDIVAVGSAAATAASWTFLPDTGLKGALAHNQQYFVTAQAGDAAVPVNTSSFAVSGATFTWTDTVAPEAAASFAPSTGTSPGRVDISWVFPGDDGAQLALTYGQYAIHYSTDPGTVFSTQSAQVLISTAMVQPGEAQYYTVSGLTPEATYYFRMWVKDDADLWSAASPISATLTGERLNDTIAGTVKTPLGTGVTGVMVEAISNEGIVTDVTYTLDDGAGTFELTPLPDGIYRVQATWVEEGFASSVAKDQIPMGYADADFLLSLDYALASVSGMLSSVSPSAFSPSAAGGEAQLWRGTHLLARAYADATGRFTINNLIPGSYTLKVLSGAEVRTLDIKLAPGEALQIDPLGTILRKDRVYAYPNPASAHVTFHVESEIFPVRVRVSVFALDGRLVKTFEGAITGAAAYEAAWNFSGGFPASGVYIYSVRIADDLGDRSAVTTRKFAVLR